MVANCYCCICDGKCDYGFSVSHSSCSSHRSYSTHSTDTCNIYHNREFNTNERHHILAATKTNSDTANRVNISTGNHITDNQFNISRYRLINVSANRLVNASTEEQQKISSEYFSFQVWSL